MKAMKRFQTLSFFWIAACLLAACSGTLPETKALAAVKFGLSGNNAMVSARSLDTVHTPGLFSAPSPDTGSALDLSSLQNSVATETEIFGTVEAVATDTITVKGVTYSLIPTEVYDALRVGDEIRLQITVNIDGTLSIRKIERLLSVSHRSGDSHDDSEQHGHEDRGNHNHGESCRGGCSDH